MVTRAAAKAKCGFGDVTQPGKFFLTSTTTLHQSSSDTSGRTCTSSLDQTSVSTFTLDGSGNCTAPACTSTGSSSCSINFTAGGSNVTNSTPVSCSAWQGTEVVTPPSGHSTSSAYNNPAPNCFGPVARSEGTVGTNEYTTAQLKTLVNNVLSPFDPLPPFTFFGPAHPPELAAAELSANESNYSVLESQYQFAHPVPPTNSYKLNWVERFVADAGAAIASISLAEPLRGFGPNEAAVVVVTGTGTGASATATADAAGVLSSIVLGSGGINYNTATATLMRSSSGTAAVISATVAGGIVSSLAVASGGSGYGFGASFNFTIPVPGGTGASMLATVSPAGKIYQMTVEAQGTGYAPSTAIDFAIPPNPSRLAGTTGGGSGGMARVSTNSKGQITGIFLIDGGTGYADPATVSLSIFEVGSGNGSGATGHATTDGNGSISAVFVDSGGAGYVTAAVVPSAVAVTLLLSIGTETPQTYSWSGTTPGGYDPNDSTTWPQTPLFEVTAPSTNGITTLHSLTVDCGYGPTIIFS